MYKQYILIYGEFKQSNKHKDGSGVNMTVNKPGYPYSVSTTYWSKKRFWSEKSKQ